MKGKVMETGIPKYIPKLEAWVTLTPFITLLSPVPFGWQAKTSMLTLSFKPSAMSWTTFSEVPSKGVEIGEGGVAFQVKTKTTGHHARQRKEAPP
jgi:hypothetical protein